MLISRCRPPPGTAVTLAGRSDTLFSDDATALIHQTSRGYSRAVNIVTL
jgi:type II secretory pathway predicted ATPase ExeA